MSHSRLIWIALMLAVVLAAGGFFMSLYFELS
jgi:hypothetical protein